MDIDQVPAPAWAVAILGGMALFIHAIKLLSGVWFDYRERAAAFRAKQRKDETDLRRAENADLYAQLNKLEERIDELEAEGRSLREAHAQDRLKFELSERQCRTELAELKAWRAIMEAQGKS